MKITTAQLDLILQTASEVLASIASMSPADRAEVSPEWIARMQSTPEGDPWSFSYAVVDRSTGATIGGCAFKGPPDAAGIVELAYGIDEPYRGRGIATEAAQALTTFAFTDDRVSVVRGHTRPDNAASIRVMEKCGFRRIGEVIDPEDGLVVRWERESVR